MKNLKTKKKKPFKNRRKLEMLSCQATKIKSVEDEVLKLLKLKEQVRTGH